MIQMEKMRREQVPVWGVRELGVGTLGVGESGVGEDEILGR